MWQIRMYNMNHFWDEDFSKMPLIKEVKSEPNKDSILEIDGKTYRWCSINHEKKVIGVEEININPEPWDSEDEDFICPYCGSVDSDAWELKADANTIFCGSCHSKIEYERSYEVSYKVMPIQMAEVTKL